MLKTKVRTAILKLKLKSTPTGCGFLNSNFELVPKHCHGSLQCGTIAHSWTYGSTSSTCPQLNLQIYRRKLPTTKSKCLISSRLGLSLGPCWYALYIKRCSCTVAHGRVPVMHRTPFKISHSHTG